MRTHTSLLIASLLTLMLAACGREPAEAPAPTEAPGATTPVSHDTRLQGQGGWLTGTLDALPSCTVPATLSLEWKVGSDVATESVKVYVGEGAGAKLFASGGANGNGKTGPWVSPGAIFVLRNGMDDAELDRLVVPGTACP